MGDMSAVGATAVTDLNEVRPTPGLIQIGEFVFDPMARTLVRHGDTRRLTAKAAAVLRRLAERSGHVVSRDQLIDEVWSGNHYSGSRALTYTIWQVRQALDQAPNATSAVESGEDSAVETISKSGYRLRLPARSVKPGAPSDSTCAMPDSPPRIGRLFAIVSAIIVSAVMTFCWFGGNRRASTDTSGPVSLTTLEGVERFPAFSPDGHQLAHFWKRTGQPGVIRVMDLQHPDAKARVYTDSQADMLQPVWLDREHLVYERALPGRACRVVKLTLDSGAEQQLSPCYFKAGVTGLSASPDGRQLAFLQQNPATDAIAIVVRNLSDGTERFVTQPAPGMEDSAVSWSHDGRSLAFLRGGETMHDIYRLDLSDATEHRLTRQSGVYWNIAWQQDDAGLLFNAARDQDFAVWAIPRNGGEAHVYARIDSATELAVVPDGSGDLVTGLYRYSDRIEQYDLVSGKLRGSITSTWRDMFAANCPDTHSVLFVSMRKRDISLWLRQGQNSEPRLISLPSGVPEPADCTADGKQFVTVMRRTGAPGDSIVIGPLDAAIAPRVIDTPFAMSNANWSLDGASVIVSADRGNGTNLWRYWPADGHMDRLGDDHGTYGREVFTERRMWLYYTRLNQAGLWRRPLLADGSSGSPECVLSTLAADDWGNWRWHDHALWYIHRNNGHDALIRHEADGAEQTVLTLADRRISPFRSLSLTSDGQALLTIHGPSQGDIVRILREGV